MKIGTKNGCAIGVTCFSQLITAGLSMNLNTRWNALCVARKHHIGIVACVHTARWCGMDKKTIFLEVWRGSHGYAWSERGFTTIQKFKQEYDYTYTFFGQSATVFIGTEDYEMTREEALKIATDHVKGNVKVITIDLSLCGGLPARLRTHSTP